MQIAPKFNCKKERISKYGKNGKHKRAVRNNILYFYWRANNGYKKSDKCNEVTTSKSHY